MTSRRIASWLGLGMLVAGIAIIATVGVIYSRSTKHQATVSKWSPSQQQRAVVLTKKLNTRHQHSASRVAYHTRQPSLGQPAIRIRIPAIAVDSPVISTSVVGGVWQVADWAVGYLQGSAAPGTCGSLFGRRNCSTDLAAHDDIKGEIFKRLGELKPGDKVYLYTSRSVFTYVVSGQKVVNPKDGSVLLSPKRQIAMITCTPYWVDSDRIVVTATQKGHRARTPAPSGSRGF